MSKTVEERIIEMRFDNKQFEQGVKQTMSTIDKLKESLKFNNATEGVEKIQNSFNKLDFSIATRGLDNFKVQLSGLQVFANRIIENLADSLYGAIQKVNNGLTAVFRQINEGGATRAQNIEQAKFQLEGLGVAWENIKDDIDYAVSGTAYGLDVAARAASQLVASNVQLGEEMKFSLRGISGLAAMTNSSYEDIASIFTKVAGQGRLMGDDLNRIAVRGINAAAELAKVFNTTEENIRDMVSKGQIDFKTFAKAMDDAFGEHAKDANKTYAGSLSNVKAALSRIGADIKSAHFETLRKIFVDIIPQLNAFKKAWKPIEDMIIAVDEAIGSLIQQIVNMIDVKKIVDKFLPSVKKLGNKILDIIEVVKEALGEVQNYTKIGEKFTYVSREMAMAAGGFGDSIKYISKESNKAAEMSEDMAKAFQAAQDIWNKGLYGNEQERIDALTAAGIDPKKTQKIIEAFIQNGNDWDKAVQTVMEDTEEGIENNTEKAESLRKHVKRLAEVFNNLKRIIKNVVTSITNVLRVLISVITGELSEADFGDMIVSATGYLADLSDKLVITREKAEKLRRPFTLIIDILKKIISIIWRVSKGIVTAVINIVKFIGFLAGEIRSSADFSEALEKIKDAFIKLKEGNNEFINSAHNSISIIPIFEKIKSVVITVFGAITFVIDKAIEKFNKFVDIIKPVAEKISMFLKPLIDIAKNTIKAITGVLRYLFMSIKDGTLIDDIHKKIKTLTEGKGGARVAGVILGNIFNWLENFFKTIADSIRSLKLTDIVQLLKDSTMILALIKLITMIKAITSLTTNIPKLFANISKFTASTAKVNKSLARLNTANAIYAIAKSLLTISVAIGVLVGSIITIADYISKGEEAKTAFETAMKNVTDLILAVAAITGAVIVVSKLLDLVSSVFTSKSKLHIPFFLQIGIFIYSIGSTVKYIIQALITLGNMKTEILETGLERLKNVLINVGGYILIMYLATGIIQKIGRFGDVPNMFIQMGIMLFAISAAITLLVIPIAALAALEKIFGEDKVDLAVSFIKSLLLSITVMLGTVLLLGSILAYAGHNQDLAKMFLDIGLMFLAIGISLNFIVTSMLSLIVANKLDPEAATFALIGVLLLILDVMLLISVIGKRTSSRFSQALWGTVGVIVSLGILVRIMKQFVSSIKDEVSLAAAGVTILGISLMIYAMSNLMKVIGKVKPDRQSIKNVAWIFAALALIPISLTFLRGEDWPAYAAAMAGLTTVLIAMGVMLKLMGTMTGGSILATGGAFLMMAAGIAGIGIALGLVSKEVDIDKLVALTMSVILLSAALTAMVVIASRVGGLKLIGLVLSFAASMLIAAAAIGVVIVAINYILSLIPQLSDMLGQAGFEIGRGIVMFFGSIVVGIKQGIADIKSQLGVASPSTVFEEIGGYCVEGFALGIVNNLSEFVKLIPNVLKKYVIDPIKDFFDINSPSVAMEQIGQFVGDGFNNGVTESISNIDISTFQNIGSTITEALPDGSSLGGIFGDSFKEGLVDSLSFDSFEGFEGFDTSSLLGDTNITDLGESIGGDISNAIRGVDYSKLFTAEDLIDNESLYNEVKNAGQTALTDAADEVKRQRMFISMYPTFQDFLNDMDNNVAPNIVEAYRTGTDEVRSYIESALIQNYVDQTKLAADAYKYTKNGMEKALKEELQSSMYGPRTYQEDVKFKLSFTDGKNVYDNIDAILGKSGTDTNLKMMMGDTSITKNLDAINSNGTELSSIMSNLANKLVDVSNKLSTLDSNQTSRTNNVLSRISEVGNSMNNLDVLLDTGAVVGQLVGPMDSALGERARRRSRS